MPNNNVDGSGSVSNKKANRSNHVKIGRELRYFASSSLIGKGLPLILPKGAIVIQQLQRFVEDEELSRGYYPTRTPLMAKSSLFSLSGHLPYFKEQMFFTEEENDELALKAATCPFHFLIYNSQPHSYKELPLRYSEASTLFRRAASGEMYGLVRLRQFTVSEGHIICEEAQVINEFLNALALGKYFISTLGFYENVTYTFSTWDENNKNKYIGGASLWEQTQALIKEALFNINQGFEVMEGKAPFYGPKFDINLRNSYGKPERIITIQIDFSLSKMFGLTYTDRDGIKKHPIIIHRTSIGSFERMLALLIERYDGAMPTWLSPTQIRVLTVSKKYNNYGNEVLFRIKQTSIRADRDFSNEKLGQKVRMASSEKIPYIVIVGENEQNSNTLSVRSRSGKLQGVKCVDEVVDFVLKDINEKRLDAVMAQV